MATPESGATLESVAFAAGVSRQTVSNVLNAPERVAPETRQRVEEAIQALRYRPNRSARSLRTRMSNLIGYCVQPALAGNINPVLDRFVHAVTEYAAEHGFHLLLFTAPAGSAGLDRYAELLAQRAVDGFLLTDTVVGDPRPGWLTEQGVPFVAFGRSWSGPDRGRWVDVDGAAGMTEAVEHLHALGHRRIAFIGWPEGSGVGDDRVAGYTAACLRLGLDPRVVRAEGTVDTGRALAGALLDGADPPTALVCVSDLSAYGALRALADRGLRPGPDVAVVGFDDTPAARLPGVDLTSLSQPIEQIGREVVQMLLGLLGVVELPPGPEHRLLRPTLVVRASSRPAGSAPAAPTEAR
ncbi:LacI family transcriptional regulator [Jiangella aurantiaca]|uniref:LacI family transcriptional regulator n=1 Tax=Jiangella aurantiaca TaxID=2530373 RepID=A0A4R5AQ30_9ACTN|nr:LacI family DNA-binding transcriptional regulator [Jiangella aurantiaca]TDD73154.1 LacI family transcriptional regulator [Jiangella aurantiaca]